MTEKAPASEKVTLAEVLIGYRFKTPTLLESALTHPSAAEGRGVDADYERLEFLGDSLLGAIVAERIFAAYPKADEGKLTRIKVGLVAGSTLSKVAADLGLSDAIILGASELGTGGRGIHSALENVYEAIVAALYLDGGYPVATAFVEQTLLPLMSEKLIDSQASPKSRLQEKLQIHGVTPAYRLVREAGPPHDREFFVEVLFGEKVIGEGSGRSKKQAENNAAQAALDKLDAADAQN